MPMGISVRGGPGLESSIGTVTGEARGTRRTRSGQLRYSYFVEHDADILKFGLGLCTDLGTQRRAGEGRGEVTYYSITH